VYVALISTSVISQRAYAWIIIIMIIIAVVGFIQIVVIIGIIICISIVFIITWINMDVDHGGHGGSGRVEGAREGI
jgi:hypothetical protein